jgi:ABC-type nickel/cobalt efflux system permease component RcnA
MGFLIFLPFIAAIIGIIIAFICLIGIGLIIIGCTGAVMDKIYMKQMNVEKSASKSIYNIVSIILGIIILLFPLGVTLYGIISSATT